MSLCVERQTVMVDFSSISLVMMSFVAALWCFMLLICMLYAATERE